jgi:hypothetical protein
MPTDICSDSEGFESINATIKAFGTGIEVEGTRMATEQLQSEEFKLNFLWLSHSQTHRQPRRWNSPCFPEITRALECKGF